ncbi:MAG: carboxypeptidase regulatory-like domain-containing protein [Bacteroidetes bacterium]|nr:carboxypeptidase regulatory-like domain-containing protein [Bacteroidota bacterium]
MNQFQYFILTIFLIGGISLQAQTEVIVSPVITPPYSPYLQDYQDKAIITLQNTTSQDLSVKLTGRIEGDNGYALFTNPGYLPNAPILLSPLESRTIFVATEASEFLDAENLDTNIPGNVQRHILTSGLLPEGNYTFCVEARDYLTGSLLSATAPAGCVPISIQYPDPPVITNPICEAEIQQDLPVISWTPPTGNLAGALINYDLYVVPLEPNENPFEAIDRAYSYQAGNPIIFRDLMDPLYVWQAWDIPLEANREYAVQVVARDVNQRVIFNNQGRSPVCTFQTGGPSSQISGIEEISNNPFDNFLNASISGQLLYRFPGRDQFAAEGVDVETYHEIADVSNYVPHQPFDYSQPILIDNFPLNPNGADPMANKTIKLVVYTLFKMPNYPGQDPEFLVPRYGNEAYGAYPGMPQNTDLPVPYYYQGQVLDVTQTDENGNFNFNFIQLDSLLDIGYYPNGIGTAFFGGDQTPIDATAGGTIETGTSWSTFKYTGMHQVLRIEVESDYYCSPDINIIIQPEQSLNLDPLVSLVRSYSLTVQTLASDAQNQQSTAGGPLEFTEVEVLRGLNDPLVADVPEDEGQNLGESEIIPPGFTFRILSRGTTNSDGKTTFRNLVKHPIGQTGKYLLRAKTKESNTPFAYVTTVVPYPAGDGIEYGSEPDHTPYVHGSGVFPMSPYWNGNHKAIFNSEYDSPHFNTQIILEPNDPVVFGRVKHDHVGLPNVLVELTQNGQIIREELTDEDGYFEFVHLNPGNNYRLHFSRYGYQEKSHPRNVFSLQPGTFKDFQEIQLSPLGEVYGHVSSESGDGVPSDVKIADSPWYPTQQVNAGQLPFQTEGNNPNEVSVTGLNTLDQKSMFHFPAQSGNRLLMIIDPYSDKYFSDTLTISIPESDGNLTYLGAFIVKEKLHRPEFHLKDEQGNNVTGAQILIQEQELSTNRIGMAATTFASPASEFLLTIIPPEGSQLVPLQQYLTIPISKEPIRYDITLSQGQSISGMVTAGPDSLPLPNARVFLDTWQTYDYEIPVIETFTDAQGNYTLNGLPEEYVSTAGGNMTYPLKIVIRAVKSDPATAYIGDMQEVFLPEDDPVNFHLEIMENTNLSQIWGFDVEIESASQSSGNNWTLSGSFINLPSNPNFSLLLPETRLDFVDLPVTMVPGSAGTLIPDPQSEAITLDRNSLHIGIKEQFQGTVQNINYDPGNASSNLLQMKEKTPEKGVIEGKVEIDLASFNFSYNYTGKLHLGDGPDNALVEVFQPQSVSYPDRSFNVLSLRSRTGNPAISDPWFKVHEFNASADRFQSYIDKDTVALFTVLHTEIPFTAPPDLEIQAGHIKVLPNTILPFEQGAQLEFMLEDWNIVSNSGWYYNNNYGGLHIPNATIKTGVIDVPVKDMIVQFDDIDVGSMNLHHRTGGSSISLAGVAPLDLHGNEPVLYLDPKVPTDLQPHWRIEILGDAENPAATTSIPEFAPQQVSFTSFSLISNGEQYLVVEDQSVLVYDVLEFDLHGIQTSYNFFTLTGEADLKIPEVPSNSGVLKFTKPGDAIQMDFEHFEVAVSGLGKVEFIDDNYVGAQGFVQGEFSAMGTLIASDDLGNNIQLKSRLVRTPAQCFVEVVQVNNENQKVVCGQQGSNYLEVTQGLMPANLSNQSWEMFEFDAYPRSDVGLEQNTQLLHFQVVGAIKADQSAISVTDLSTDFGGMTIIYNLVDHSLFAQLEFAYPVPMGVVTLFQGNLNFKMSDKGFYFMLAAEGNVPVVGDVNVISLAGHYSQFPAEAASVWSEYALQDFPEAFANGFSGFVVNCLWEPVDASAGITIIPGEVYMDFTAYIGLEVRVYFDFGDAEYGFSALGRGDFILAFSAPCFDAGLGLRVELLLGMQITDDDFLLQGCASVNLFAYYHACAPVIVPPNPSPVCTDWCSADCWTGGVRVDLEIGDSVGGVEFDVELDGPPCSGQPMEIEAVAEEFDIDCN